MPNRVGRILTACLRRVMAGLARSAPSIRVDYGGQFQEQHKSFRDLVFVLVLAIVLVFTVLLFEFGGFSAPFAHAPFCPALYLRSFRGLLLTGATFNLSSFMG